MATFTLTIPDAKLQDLIDAYGDDYQAMLPGGGANPETRIQYSKRKLLEHIKQPVINHKRMTYQYPDFDSSGLTIS